MGRGDCKRRVRSKDKGSDDSDEDYTVGVDEEDSEGYCSSLVADEFLEEEEEGDGSKGKMGFLGTKRNKVVVSRFSWKEEKDVIHKDDYHLDNHHQDNDEDEDEDYEYKNEDDDDDNEDDEDFIPGEIDLDLEDELEELQKKKARRSCLQEKSSIRGRKRKRNSDGSKRALKKKKPTTSRGLKSKSIDGDCRKKKSVKEKTGKSPASKRRRRRCREISDSDYATSESSDFEYTISEEEREQVREADTFCQDLITSLSHSTCSKRLQEERGDSLQQRKRGHQRKKGKEKVADLNIESVVKPVCGICLSEQGKKTVRGTLNCCDHYFCFACIMEWSKVESRCPLCKQRFVTISKPSRSTLVGFDLRTTVVQVPERDQVYQPSEDELRDYVDPYIDVICTECHQGGDDALMLLCDLCDSPAHTFCVGLGRQVPEGNWYCEGCRPTALASLDPILAPNHRGTNELPGTSGPENVRVAIDLNRPYVPELPFAQGIGFPSTHGGGDPPAASVPGASVLTVSERRRIQLQINNLLNSRMGHLGGGTSSGMSPTTLGMNSFGTAQAMQATQQVASFPHSVTQEALLPSHHSFSWGGFESSTHPRGSRAYAASTDGFVSGMLQVGVSGIINRDADSRLDYEEHHLRGSISSVADR